MIIRRVGDGSAGPCIRGDRGKTALPMGRCLKPSASTCSTYVLGRTIQAAVAAVP
jgi:hypothetical protein